MDPLIGYGLVSGGLSLLGSLFGSSDARSYNEEMLERQLEWQQQENDKDRAWQSEEARLARASAQAYESSEYDRRYSLNSPAAQAQRLIAAGISPQAMSGQNATPSLGGISGSSASAGGSHGIGNIAGADAGILTAGYSNINALFDTANKLADLAKKSSEMPYFSEFIQKQIKALDAQADKSLADTHYQEFINKVNDIIGSNKYSDYEVKKWDAELQRLRSAAALDDEKAVTERTQQFLNETERWCKGEQFEQLKIVTKHLEKQILQDLAYKNAATHEAETRSTANISQSAVNYQQARYYNALTQTEDDMRNWKVMYQRFAAEGQSEAAQRAWEVHGHAVLSDITKMEREGLITEKLQQDIIKAQKDNDWYTVSKLMGFAESISRTALYASKTGKNVKDMFTGSDASDAAVMEYLAP